MFACGDERLPPHFASRLAPTKTRRNVPAGPGLCAVGDKPASECSPAVMNVCRHPSPAGWLLQRQAATPRQGLACPLWELACQRMFACGDERLPARFASRLAPTKTRRNVPAGVWLVPCGSWPASECSPAVMNVCRHDSPAGWLLQRQAATLRRGLDFPCGRQACQRMFACGDARLPAPFASRLAPTRTSRNAPAESGLSPVGDKPASECSSAVMHVCRHPSPAGWLLHRQAATSQQGLACVLWETSLPANVRLR
jgi:hypothetical protein